MANLTLAVINVLPDNPLELARRHLDHCRVVSLRDSEVFLRDYFFYQMDTDCLEQKMFEYDTWSRFISFIS